MQTNYGHWSDHKLMPVFRLWLIEEPPPTGWLPTTPGSALVACDALCLSFPESESTPPTVTPITKRTMYGGDRQVANLMTLTHFTSVQEHTALQQELAKYVGKRVSAKVQFGGYRGSGMFGLLGPSPSELPGYQSRFLYLTSMPAWDARVEVNFRVEPAEFRMRTIITLSTRLHPKAPFGGLLWGEDSYWW